jgi:hypothetical protein
MGRRDLKSNGGGGRWNQLAHWLESRTGIQQLLHEALFENVPGARDGDMCGEAP